MNLSLNLNPRKIGVLLGLVAVLLALQSLYAEYVLANILGMRSNSAPARLLDLFSVNLEESIPTWYSSLNLFLAAALLGWIALARHRQAAPGRRYWIGLAAIFLVLSMDEGAAIHESASGPLQRAFDTSGFFEFGWLLLGIPVVLIFGLLYARFWWRLPGRTRTLFAIAGGLYVGGAIIIEGISASQYAVVGGSSFRYLAIATVEETFEMLGVVVFIYALLDYLQSHNQQLVLHTQAAPPESDPVRFRWPLSLPVTALAFGVLALLVNGGLLAWGSALHHTAPPAETAAAPYHFYILVEELAGEGVTLTHFSGVFSPADEDSRRTAAMLLAGFPAVEILSLPALDASIAIASDTPVLTGDLIIDLMDWIDETEYIYYDTATIQALVALR